MKEGREFQSEGALKEKDRRPEEDVSLGTKSRLDSDDLRDRTGVYGLISSLKYTGDLWSKVL